MHPEARRKRTTRKTEKRGQHWSPASTIPAGNQPLDLSRYFGRASFLVALQGTSRCRRLPVASPPSSRAWGQRLVARFPSFDVLCFPPQGRTGFYRGAHVFRRLQSRCVDLTPVQHAVQKCPLPRRELKQRRELLAAFG